MSFQISPTWIRATITVYDHFWTSLWPRLLRWRWWVFSPTRHSWICTSWAAPTTSLATVCRPFLPLWRGSVTSADSPPPSSAWTTRGRRNGERNCEHRSRFGHPLLTSKSKYCKHYGFCVVACCFLAAPQSFQSSSTTALHFALISLLDSSQLLSRVMTSLLYISSTLNVTIAWDKRGFHMFSLRDDAFTAASLHPRCVTLNPVSLCLKEDRRLHSLEDWRRKCLKLSFDFDGFQSPFLDPLRVTE